MVLRCSEHFARTAGLLQGAVTGRGLACRELQSAGPFREMHLADLARPGLRACPAARGTPSALTLVLRGGASSALPPALTLSLEEFFTSAVSCVNYAIGAILLFGCVLAIANTVLFQVIRQL